MKITFSPHPDWPRDPQTKVVRICPAHRDPVVLGTIRQGFFIPAPGAVLGVNALRILADEMAALDTSQSPG